MEFKSLKLMNEFKKDVSSFLKSFDKHYKKDEEYISAKTTLLNINEAIEELEVLNNKSCSNCKHFIEFDSRMVRDRCNLLNISNIGGCGDYWEQK